MRVSTDFFGRQFQDQFPLSKGEVILDYGCGPGFLIDNLVASNATVVGADISEFFLHQNRIKHPLTEFVHISEDADSTVDILSEKLRGRKFDYIILLSIIQYFKSHSDIGKIVKALSASLNPNGKIIIADVLDEKTSSVADALGIFKECIKRGRTIAFVRFILYLMFSDYRNVSKSNELLQFPESVAGEIAGSCNLSVRKMNGLTPHPTRTNYIFSNK
jgi:2-polyprenyl-3-methyl-5-hydroxy-6-metoxy-1,4-benzoquinol methylase